MNSSKKFEILTEVKKTTSLLNIDTIQRKRPTSLIKVLRLKNWCVSSKAALITFDVEFLYWNHMD